jgi:Spy/CpxP family protein refolding chaperone
MKKLLGLGIFLGLFLGVNSALFAQGGQNPPPQPDGQRRMGRPGDGPGKMRRGMRGGRGERRERRGMRDGRGGGMRGGFGISDEELAKLNLTNDQKVKLYDFRMRMLQERQGLRQDRQPGERMNAEGVNREEMRQLMSAKALGTLTAEQKAKLDQFEANRKQAMDKRKTEMDQRRAKMEQTHQEFLNIFTLDQRKQLEQLRAQRTTERQQRQQQRQQRRGPGGPGQPKQGQPAQPKPNN